MISKIRFTKEPIIILAMSFFSGRQRGASKIQLTNQQQQNTKIRITLFLAIDTLVTGNLATDPPLPADPGRPRQRTNEQGSVV
jgi:hypothetical protein